MSILRAAATANDTLDQTSDTLVNSLTLTPAADDYLLFATVEFLTAGSAGTEDTTFSVYVGGTQVAHTERVYGEDTSVDNANWVYALNCKVSPNGSQAVEIRYRTSSASSPMVARNRELNLFPIPAAGTDYEKSATGDATIASATYATLGSMTETPAADDYLLVFSTTCRGPNGSAIGFKVVVGGTDVAHTQRITEQESSAWDSDNPVLIACKVSPNGSQTVDIEWARTQGSGTVTCGPRTMNLIPLDGGDIFEASGTTDDADSTTTDKQVDDLLITDPGAADYLCILSGYQSYGTIGAGAGETTFSLRTAGTKVTDSERINEVENSLDNTFLCCAAGGRVTVVGATDDLQGYWQGQTTDTRTIHERSFVAIREVAVGAIDASPALVFAGSADLKGDGKLDATAALLFAGATVDLKGRGKLDATAALAFGGTADLEAPGKLDSTAALVFGAPTVDLKALGKLDATAALIFAAATALLRGTGALAATAAMAFSATADLKQAPSPITATAALVFSATADLRGQGKLDATSALIFSATADLNARGKLDSTSAMVFSSTADLDAQGKLDATAALVFTGAADLDASGQLDATAALVFSATANLVDDAGGAVSASPAMVFSAASNLDALGKLDASPAMTFSQTANLTGMGALSASPVMVFAGTADLGAPGKLDAAAALIFSATADLADGVVTAPFYHIDVTAETRDVTLTGFAGRIN